MVPCGYALDQSIIKVIGANITWRMEYATSSRRKTGLPGLPRRSGISMETGVATRGTVAWGEYPDPIGVRRRDEESSMRSRSPRLPAGETLECTISAGAIQHNIDRPIKEQRFRAGGALAARLEERIAGNRPESTSAMQSLLDQGVTAFGRRRF